MLRRASATVIVISAIFFVGVIAMWFRSRHTRDAFSWISNSGNLREVSFADGVCFMQTVPENSWVHLLAGRGEFAPEFFVDSRTIRNLEAARNSAELGSIYQLLLSGDESVRNEMQGDRQAEATALKRSLMAAIATESLGRGEMRTTTVRGEYSESGFLGMYVGNRNGRDAEPAA